MEPIIIASMYRAKNKQAFFAMHQIQSKIHAINPNADIEFHILWDDANDCSFQEEPKWRDLIDYTFGNLHNYDRAFFDNYVTEYYGLDYTEKFKTWPAIYTILLAHYLRRVKLKHYYLTYDDDILINCDFKEVYDSIISRTPCFIAEPMNPSCDKIMFEKLVQIYGNEFADVYLQQNPYCYGFNGGFQGIDLSIYDDFLSKDSFELLLNLFEYKSTIGPDGKEIWGIDRFHIDTQQQSFLGTMNISLSKKPINILDINEYFVVPTFGEHPVYGTLTENDGFGGWSTALKSKIVHFIGHTEGRGKPKQFLDRVDEYLLNNNFTL